jgi:Rrf2 family iron-sulfur cluster assembly transcriptional regulator
LARPSAKISVAEIVVAVDEPLDATNCGEMGNCRDGQPCVTHDLWMGLNEKIYAYLAEVSLQQLIDNHAKNNTGMTPVTMSKTSLKQAAM